MPFRDPNCGRQSAAEHRAQGERRCILKKCPDSIYFVQFQTHAQIAQRLVAVKARFVGGNLKEYTARRAEIDGFEIIAVDDWGHLIARV